MGQVIPFITRARDSGDWTADERARLDELADRLAAAGVGVEVVFGVSDAGDPWCVVKGEDEEILIHVARIGGTFVVHSALDQILTEGRDLQALLRERLETGLDAAVAHPEGEVVPFDLRRAQTFLALAVAVGFLYETAAPAPAHAAELPDPLPAEDDDGPPPTPADPAPQDRDLTVQTAAALEAEPDRPVQHVVHAAAPEPPPQAAAASVEPQPAPLLATPAAPAETVEMAAAPAPRPPTTAPTGTDGDDLIVGSAGAERLLGAAGDDTLQGNGGADVLDGGAGDDRIEFTDGALAIGGRGADTFVLHALTQPSGGQPLLGLILDFNAAEGDTVVTARGETVTIVPNAPRPPGPQPGPENALGPIVGPPSTPAMTPGSATVTPVVNSWDLPPRDGYTFRVHRRDVDLDGDGEIDGFVLVATLPQLDGGAAPMPFDILGPDPVNPGRFLVDINGDREADYDLVAWEAPGSSGLYELSTVPRGWQPPDFGS